MTGYWLHGSEERLSMILNSQFYETLLDFSSVSRKFNRELFRPCVEQRGAHCPGPPGLLHEPGTRLHHTPHGADRAGLQVCLPQDEGLDAGRHPPGSQGCEDKEEERDLGSRQLQQETHRVIRLFQMPHHWRFTPRYLIFTFVMIYVKFVNSAY